MESTSSMAKSSRSLAPMSGVDIPKSRSDEYVMEVRAVGAHRFLLHPPRTAAEKIEQRLGGLLGLPGRLLHVILHLFLHLLLHPKSARGI